MARLCFDLPFNSTPSTSAFSSGYLRMPDVANARGCRFPEAKVIAKLEELPVVSRGPVERAEDEMKNRLAALGYI